MITIPAAVAPAIETLLRHDTYPVIVGGYVRDALLGAESKDIDIEVYNVKNYETLEQLLEPCGRPVTVGRTFGVIKMALGGYDVDFSLPRTESKSGPGHRGFNVTLNPQLDFATASRRRDFTINAMGFDLKSSFLLDPHGGAQDLKRRILRCVDPDTFVEDPLRVYRAMQMSARFDLACTGALLKLCGSMAEAGMLEELPKARIFEEFKKLLLRAPAPSAGLAFLNRTGVIRRFAELDALYIATGDTIWGATLRALDLMAAERTGAEREDLILMFAALCLRFGSAPESDAFDAKEASEATRRFLFRITDEKELIEAVALLVEYHRTPMDFYRHGTSDYEIRKLVLTLPLERLLKVAAVAHHALDPQTDPEEFLAGEWLQKRVGEINATPETLKPLLLGRDLVAAGYTPSPEFKVILSRAYQAQLKGLFNTRDGALEWFEAHADRG
jgi:tRNA nucleotidyltransferase (CCA-adding enzyme)